MSATLLRVSELNVQRGLRLVLQEVGFELKEGEILGLIGPNGSGKSTLLKALAGIIPTLSGSISLSGQDLLKQTIFERSRLLTYVGSEVVSEFPVTASQMVAMSRGASIESIMRETGCWDFRDRLVAELSGGERQRVAIARSLAQGAKVICLDESISKLDLHHQSAMGKLLKKFAQAGISFILVNHDLNYTADWADRSIFLRQGKIVAMDETERLMNEDSLRLLYPDVQLSFLPHPKTGKPKVFFLD